MTIISDRTQYALPQQDHVRSRAAGQSFAARIEAGDRAKNILQERALSFSETGLLGLHYANDALNKMTGQSVSAIGTGSLPDITGANIIKLFDNAATPPANEPTDILITRYSGPAGGYSVSNEPAQSATKPGSSLPLAEIVVIDPDVAANECVPTVSKIRKQAAAQNSPGVRFGLKVVEMPHGISVICEESAVSENEIQELTDLAQQVAKDFGVTIRRLIVNGNRSF